MPGPSRSSLKARRIPGSARTGATAVAMAKRMSQRQGRRDMSRIPVGSLQASPASRMLQTIKGVDSDISQSIIATTTTNAGIDVLNLIVPGSGSWNRVGRKTVCKSVRIKGNLLWANVPTFATGQGMIQTAVRGVLVWDNQPTGTIPTFDVIFGSTLQAGTEQVTSIFDPVKYDGMERFRVIREWCWEEPPVTVPAFGTGPNMQATVCIDEYVKLPGGGLVSNYSGQSSPQTIADIASGALYLLWRTTSSTAGGSVTLDAMARLRYYD